MRRNMLKCFINTIVLVVAALQPVYAGDNVYFETQRDAKGQSLYGGLVNAQGGELAWNMDLSREEGVQTVKVTLFGKPMGRQARSAVITHGTREMTDRIKVFLDKNKGDEQARKREQVNQAQDFLESTLRDILDAPRMSDLKEEASQPGARREKSTVRGINVDVVIKGEHLSIVDHDNQDRNYTIDIPRDAVNAFIEEMRVDPELGQYVREKSAE